MKLTGTIIATKEEVNRNIRFLESKNWKYIISYRMKAGSKQFKEYVLDEKDYVNEVVWYTKLVILHLIQKKRINGHFRRQIISFSKNEQLKTKTIETF